MWRSFVAFVDRIVSLLVRVFSVLGAVLMALLTIVVFTEVVSRYFFGLPIAFTGELTTVIFPWMTFLMAVEVTKNRDHISITYFRGLLPKKTQWLLRLFSMLVVLSFSVFMVVSSYRLSVASININLPVLRFMTKAHQYSSLTVSFLLISLVAFSEVIRFLVSQDTIASDDTKFLDVGESATLPEDRP